MIPDAPHLPEWVLAYAEYEGQRIALIDHVAAGCYAFADTERWSVSHLHTNEIPRGACPCQKELGVDATRGDFYSDEAEAWAAYRREADALMGREETFAGCE